MSRNFFHIHHVESKALLPEVLSPGTAYFVDDEKCIIVDYGDGRGRKIYGGTAGVTVNPAGNSGFIQEQVNTLAGGVLAFEKTFWDETQYIRRELEHKAALALEDDGELRRMSGANAEGIIRLAEVINDQADNTGDQIAGLHRQTNANSEGILRLCLTVYEHAAKTDEAIRGLKASITALQERLGIISSDPTEDIPLPPPPPPPPPPPITRPIVWADILRPGDKVSVDGYTWTVVIALRDPSCILLVLDQDTVDPE